jgi:hypothetical protein
VQLLNLYIPGYQREKFYVDMVKSNTKIAYNIPTFAEGRDRRTPAASEYSKSNQKINRFQTHLSPALGWLLVDVGQPRP